MAEKILKKVYGIARPADYFSSWANLETKVDLEVGDLVAIDTDGKLIKATHEKKPVGIVSESDTKKWGEAYQFTGERDATKLGKGARVSLHKHFLASGVFTESQLSGKNIGDLVYLGDSGLTLEKPATGFVVGMIERIGDGMVRFDLTLTALPVAGE